MTKKEWLNRSYKINCEITALQEHKEKLLTLCCKCTKPTDGEKIDGSNGNAIEDRFIDFTDYSIEIDKKIKLLIKTQKQTLKVIYAVEDNILRTVLIERYLNFNHWQDIADKLNLKDIRHVFRLHNKALEKIKIKF